MKYSVLLGGAAVALFATNALAVVNYPAGKTTFVVDGFTTAGTGLCGTAGTPTHSTILYPGASTPTSVKTGLSLIIPSSTSSGPATTTNCIQGHLSGTKLIKEPVPIGGLDGQTLNFVCYSDTSTALGSGLPISVQFTVKPTASVNAQTAKAITTIAALGCSSTTQTTWAAE